jgi:two-component system nitrate/nitrite response regulator NarL
MKLLVVDDHPIVRDGLAALLGRLGPDTVVLQVGDAVRALAMAVEHADLDIVILDIAMPGMDGLHALSEFGRVRPELPVIVISASEDARDAREALAKGALGYVPKSASQHTLLSAIRLVLDGDLYVPPLILGEPPLSPALDAWSAAVPAGSALTRRQIEVLKQLSQGKSNKSIALELGLSEKTVKAHVTAIFKALNVANRTQAAAAAREAGLILTGDASPPSAARLSADFVRLAMAARSLPLGTGLWSSRRPLALASASRPGAVSPVMSTAGIASLYPDRSRSITATPVSSPRRR